MFSPIGFLSFLKIHTRKHTKSFPAFIASFYCFRFIRSFSYHMYAILKLFSPAQPSIRSIFVFGNFHSSLHSRLTRKSTSVHLISSDHTHAFIRGAFLISDFVSIPVAVLPKKHLYSSSSFTHSFSWRSQRGQCFYTLLFLLCSIFPVVPMTLERLPQRESTQDEEEL